MAWFGLDWLRLRVRLAHSFKIHCLWSLSSIGILFKYLAPLLLLDDDNDGTTAVPAAAAAAYTQNLFLVFSLHREHTGGHRKH